MAERFNKLYSLSNNLFLEGSPVIITAGSLLNDTLSGKVIAQIKFHSVSSKTIKAVKIGISAYDITEKSIDGVDEYQYLDLNIHNGQEFGSNKAIVLPSSVTRSFSISSIVVVFHDGTTWECTNDFRTLSSPKSLAHILNNGELQKQYKLSTNEKAAYLPTEEMGLWQCTCGSWNNGYSCTECKCFKEKVFSSLDITYLNEQIEVRLAKEKAQQEADAILQAKLQEEKGIQKAKTAKKIRIAVIVAVIVAIIVAIGSAIYAKTKEITIEKLLALYTKEDVISLLGKSDKDSKNTLYDVSFKGDKYSLMLSYEDDKLDWWSLTYNYPGLDNVDSIYDIPDYVITTKDETAANSILAKQKDAFGEKFGEPEVAESDKSAITYTWIVNDRKIELIDYTDNRELSLVSAISIRVNCNHQSFCEHPDIKEEKSAATCTDDGYERKTCTVCGYIDEVKSDALGHKETSTVLKEPTCTDKGETEYSCSVCGNKRKEETDALGHDHKKSTTKAAGCTSTGIFTYTCSRCKDNYTETIAALGHSMSAATCTNDGKCSRCGKKGDSARGHSWNKDYDCINCSASYKPNVKISSSLPCTTSNDVTIKSVSIVEMDAYTSLDGSIGVKVTIKINGYNDFWMGPTSASLQVYDENGNLEGGWNSESFIIMEEFSSFTKNVTIYVSDGGNYTLVFS